MRWTSGACSETASAPLHSPPCPTYIHHIHQHNQIKSHVVEISPKPNILTSVSFIHSCKNTYTHTYIHTYIRKNMYINILYIHMCVHHTLYACINTFFPTFIICGSNSSKRFFLTSFISISFSKSFLSSS